VSCVASAAYNTVQQVGAAFGTALLNSIATSVTASYLTDHGNGPQSINAGDRARLLRTSPVTEG